MTVDAVDVPTVESATYAGSVNNLSEMEIYKRLQQVEHMTSSAEGDKKTTVGSSNVSEFVSFSLFQSCCQVCCYSVQCFNTFGWVTGRVSSL